MNDYSNYSVWLAKGGWIRVSARAIILNQGQERILIERSGGMQSAFANFIGGGVEVGETLQAAIERELNEETNAKVTRTQYLFVVENFFAHKSEIRHSLEHYFEVELDRGDIVPKNAGVEFTWIPIAELAAVDLRPLVVRESIIDGSYRRVGHLIIGDAGA